MTVLKEKLTDIKEKFEKAHKIIDEESKNDPPTDPYRSHYNSQKILLELEKNLKNAEESDSLIYRAILGYVMKDIGRIYMFTEEPHNAEKYFQNALEHLALDKLTASILNVYIDTLNQTAILWSNRGDNKRAKEYLVEAESLYKDFKAQENVEPLTISDLFGSPDEVEKGKGSVALEKLHTLTLYYMAQVLGEESLHESARYCRTTLIRQLKNNDYDPIDWALNSATLSQYYFTKNALKQSRHLLAAASWMLDKYEQELVSAEIDSEQRTAKMETLNHRAADLARCWAKYGIHVLSTSRERLMAEKDSEEYENLMENLKIATDFEPFDGVDLSLYEAQVTDEFVLTYEDAKLVFINAQNWLDKAKGYYKPDSEATEYVRIVQDHVSLYKYLAFFDDDDANQAKFHKKRADMLEELSALLNPNYYTVLCREIWYELGLTYSMILDIKLGALEQLGIDERPTPHALTKINRLCDKSIRSFQQFLDSYRDKETKEIPKNLDDDNMQPILFAYFHIGRLFYKIITPDKRMQLHNVKNSLQHYELFCKSCEEHKTVAEGLKAEIGVCKEMIGLLPIKMRKLMQELEETT